ncbi:hypothetical protein [Hafnia alvei]|nr:hypothetical protein [Hafnia alvei]
MAMNDDTGTCLTAPKNPCALLAHGDICGADAPLSLPLIDGRGMR